MNSESTRLFEDPMLDERLAFWTGILIRETEFAQAAQMVLRDAATVFGLTEVESTHIAVRPDGKLVGLPIWVWNSRGHFVDNAVDTDGSVDITGAAEIPETLGALARRGNPFHIEVGDDIEDEQGYRFVVLIVPVTTHGTLEQIIRFRHRQNAYENSLQKEALRRLGHWFFDAYTRSVEIRRWQAVKALELEISRRSILTSLNQTMDHRENLRRANELLERQNRELIAANSIAQKSNRLKSEFLATTSHELRTPLNAILGFLSFYMANPDAGESERLECVNTAHSSAQQLLDIINKVLEIANIESGRTSAAPMEFPIVYLFQEIDRFFGPKVTAKNLEWRLEYPENQDLGAYANLPKLRETLMNVLDNALKFTPTGSVSLSAVPDTDGFTKIEVRDTGIGFAEDIAQHLFTPFSQADSGLSRKFGGTGLGLAISKKLMELMGGTVTVDSPGPGLGAVVTIRVPGAPATADAAVAVAPSAAESQSRHIDDTDRLNVMLCGLPPSLSDEIVARADANEFAFTVQSDLAAAGIRLETEDVDATVSLLSRDEDVDWFRKFAVAKGIPTVVATSFDDRKIQTEMDWMASPSILFVVQMSRIERDPGPVLRALGKLRRKMLAAH